MAQRPSTCRPDINHHPYVEMCPICYGILTSGIGSLFESDPYVSVERTVNGSIWNEKGSEACRLAILKG